MKTKKNYLKSTKSHTIQMIVKGLLCYSTAILSLFLLSCSKEKDKYIENGQLAFQNSFYDLAIQEYEKALKLDSTSANVYYLSGDAYYEQNKYSQTIKAYEKAMLLDPKEKDLNADICFKLGFSYKSLKEYDKAITIFQKSLTLDPKHKNSYINLAEIYYYNKEDYKNAIKNYNKVINIQAIDTIYAYLGICYRLLNDYDNAIKSFNKSIDLNSKNAASYNGLGITYFKKKDFEKGIIYFQKALEIESDNTTFYENLGIGYYTLKKYDEAISTFQKAIDIDKSCASAYRRLGKTYFDKENKTLEESEKMFKCWVIAAQLGDEIAKEVLRKENLDWTKYNFN